MNIPKGFRPEKGSDSKLEELLVMPELKDPLKNFRNSSFKILRDVFDDVFTNFDFDFFFNTGFLDDYKETREMYEFFDSELSSRFKHYAPFTIDCLLFCDSFFRSKNQFRYSYETNLEKLMGVIKLLEGNNDDCINFADILDMQQETNKRFSNLYMEFFFLKVYANLLENHLKKPAEFAIRAIIFPYIYQGSKKSPHRKKNTNTLLRPHVSKLGYCNICLDKSSEIIHKIFDSKTAYHVKEVSNVLKGIYMH